jgi:integrase/recombinase XerC
MDRVPIRRFTRGIAIAPMNDLVPVPPPSTSPAISERIDQAGVCSAWLASQANELTRRTYETAIGSFFDSVPWPTEKRPALDECARAFFTLKRGDANYLGASWIAARIADGKRSNTVAKGAAALGSLCAFARRMGVCDWELDLKPPTREVYRDVAGPPVEWLRKIFRAATSDVCYCRPWEDLALAARNLALLRLGFDQGLRVGEIVSLDLMNFDGDKLHVIQKRKVERAPLALAPKPIEAIEGWLQYRGRFPGPLFVRLDNARRTKLKRLGSKSVGAMVAKIGRRVGYPKHLTFHALRHAAISRAAFLADGNLLKVKDFSRHKNIETVMIYVDHLKNQYQSIAVMLGEQTGD